MSILRDPNRGLGRFATPLRLEFLARGERVRHIEDFIYVGYDGKEHVTPAGFIMDGASIPRLLWSECGAPLQGPNVFVGAVHDPLYRFGKVSKEEADLILWDVALLAGHSPEIAAAMYEAVRIGGGEAWSENQRKRTICGSDMARLMAWC